MTNKIEAIRKDKTAFKMGGIWLSMKPGTEVPGDIRWGDHVVFDKDPKGYVTSMAKDASAPTTPKKSYGNSSGSYTTGESRKFPIGPRDYSRAINRQNALTNSVKFVSDALYGNTMIEAPPDLDMDALDNLTDVVIKVARKFEQYTTGDLDMEAAKTIISEIKGEKE